MGINKCAKGTKGTEGVPGVPQGPKVSLVMGWSGAGKDTVGGYLQGTLVKFAAPGKRALEGMLKIPTGSLDDRVFRQQVAPWCQGRTYLEVLIDFYKHKGLVIGEDLFTQQSLKLIQESLDKGVDVVITDLRSWDEYKVIVSLSKTYDVMIYWVERNSAKMLESDHLQQSIYQELQVVAKCTTTICNNGTRQNLFKQLDK